MGNSSVLDLEIYDCDQWRPLGTVALLESESLGLNAKTEFTYNFDHTEKYVDRRDLFAASCLVPVSFEPTLFEGWPPFLLDLFPQGAALKYVVNQYRIADRPENYWRILRSARLSPPGNIRVVVTSDKKERFAPSDSHPGFSRLEVITKGPEFLEHMVRCGAPIAGTTGAGGSAPKFLLREDHRGQFHADGGLCDEATKALWLVKFPRGQSADDRHILRSEQILMTVAKEFGFTAPEFVIWENDCLFVSRFDREIRNKSVMYLGLESFYSIVGSCDFGSRLEHQAYLRALAAYSTNSKADALEYVFRDFFNVMVGNTDNHGRNSSVWKGDGWVRLAPVYDLAPMKFDPEGVVRHTRWGFAEGDLSAISKHLYEELSLNPNEFYSHLRIFYAKATKLELRLKELGMPEAYIEGTRSDRESMLDSMQIFLRKNL